MSSKLEPAIWSRDTGQRISWYDSCQLNIVCMSNIKDICCNPRLHDLVLAGWPLCCATSFVVRRRRRRRRWAHAPVIHAASHFDHKKRVAWVPISMPGAGQKTSQIFVYASSNKKWRHIRSKVRFPARFTKRENGVSSTQDFSVFVNHQFRFILYWGWKDVPSTFLRRFKRIFREKRIV